MQNRFSNTNVIGWKRWILTPDYSKAAGAIYFLSRRYGTSPRFFPLFDHLRNTQVILFQGSRLPGFDRIYLKLLPMFILLFKRRLAKYPNFIALNSSSRLVVSTDLILNLDDPTYQMEELAEILRWERTVRASGHKSTIICTTEQIEEYLVSGGVGSKIVVIPQGHSSQGSLDKNLLGKTRVKFVYISPSIDSHGDPHAGHKMWDATPLLRDIWPLVSSETAELHLIGRLGKNASELANKVNISSHGLLSIEECTQLLKSFDVALYPRIHDNGWMPQKLVEYLGAGLPVIAFKLQDTKIVEELGVGILVESISDFARAIDEVSNQPQLLEKFKKNCSDYSARYSWVELARQFEESYS